MVRVLQSCLCCGFELDVVLEYQSVHLHYCALLLQNAENLKSLKLEIKEIIFYSV